MANLALISSFGIGAEVDFSYDDATMLMDGFNIRNASQKSLRIEMVSPRGLSRTFGPGTNITQTLPTGQRPAWAWRSVLDDQGNLVQKISGLEWRAWME